MLNVIYNIFYTSKFIKRYFHEHNMKKNCSLMTESSDTLQKLGKVAFGRIPKKQAASGLENWKLGSGVRESYFSL